MTLAAIVLNINIPRPLVIIFVTIFISLGLSIVSRLQGELLLLPPNNFPPLGPFYTLAHLTIYVGFYLFLTSIGWSSISALLACFLLGLEDGICTHNSHSKKLHDKLHPNWSKGTWQGAKPLFQHDWDNTSSEEL